MALDKTQPGIAAILASSVPVEQVGTSTGQIPVIPIPMGSMALILSAPLNLTGTTLSINLATGSLPGLMTAAQFSVIGSLATVATTGAYSDLTGKPTLGTAAAQATGAFATAAQGTKADTAIQPGNAGLIVADTGWTANADSGSKTVAIGSTATLDTIATALNIVTAGAGTQLENIAQKVKAIEAALVNSLRPNV